MAGRARRKFPWAPFILLLVSIYVFWILPLQLPKPELKVEFESPISK